MYRQELVKLSRAGVRYLVIGGIALGLSGYPRTTLDLDLFVDFSEQNLGRFLRVLDRMGYKPLPPVDPAKLMDPEERGRLIKNKHAKVFTFLHAKKPLSLIDILLESPISFEDAWKRSRAVIVGGERVRVACPEDLLAFKQSAGREKDREDIKVLKKIIELERWKKKKL
jgi:hypothetical protein